MTEILQAPDRFRAARMEPVISAFSVAVMPAIG